MTSTVYRMTCLNDNGTLLTLVWEKNQNSNQWQCSIIVMCLSLYHVTSLQHCHWREFWWYGRISYIFTFWYNFDTVLCQFLETGTSDRCIIGIVLLLRISGFSLYALSFFPFSPFKEEKWVPKVNEYFCKCHSISSWNYFYNPSDNI